MTPKTTWKLNDEQAEQARAAYLEVIKAAKAADLDSDGTVTREEIDIRINESLKAHMERGTVGEGGISPEKATNSLRFSAGNLAQAVTTLRLIATDKTDELKNVSREDLDIMIETLQRFPDLKDMAKTLPIMDAQVLTRKI